MNRLVMLVILAVLAVVVVKGWLPYLWREWLNHRRPQAHRCDVHAARARHAAARLWRRDHDAHTTGDRGRLSPRLSASRPLRPGLLGARHDHDLFRGDAARHRLDELCRAVAARGARRRLSGAEFRRVLADRIRRAADQRLSGHRQFRAHRLDGLSAVVGARLLARCRRRLLPLVFADLGHRHIAHRGQSRHHDPQAARPGHDLFPHASVLLDRPRLQPVDRRRLSNPDRNLPDAAARPLRGDALLHE